LATLAVNATATAPISTFLNMIRPPHRYSSLQRVTIYPWELFGAAMQAGSAAAGGAAREESDGLWRRRSIPACAGMT
jgi:hypothetical protein